MSCSGKKNSMYGKHHTEETKQYKPPKRKFTMSYKCLFVNGELDGELMYLTTIYPKIGFYNFIGFIDTYRIYNHENYTNQSCYDKIITGYLNDCKNH